MSNTSSAPPTAQIKYVWEFPNVAVMVRLDSSETTTFDAQVTSLLTPPNPRIPLVMPDGKFIGGRGLRSIHPTIKEAGVSDGRSAAFSLSPVFLEALEMPGFATLLDVYPDRGSALDGGRS